MLKAIFLDMDETLCDTTDANRRALQVMAQKADAIFNGAVNPEEVAERYLKGIYRKLDERYQRILLPSPDEETFRLALIDLILSDLGVKDIPADAAGILQNTFDDARTHYFDFFPGMKEQLIQWRKRFKLIVITNGPAFSQRVKVDRVDLGNYVDHILIGGLQKEEKPARSIFDKAMRLAECVAEEAIHAGDSLKTDISGANNAGIQSIWVSHGEALDSTVASPDYVIESPMQLASVIEKLSS